MSRIQFNNMTIEELKDFFLRIGEKEFRAEQLFSFIHKKHIKTIDDITVFSKSLRDKLKEIGEIDKLRIYRRFDSNVDDTKKYLLLLRDDNVIESVAMKYNYGYSACISTQVGCSMGCLFCASTKEGKVRNLEASEMLEQIYAIEHDLGITIGNIVLMGSGEPLDNYDNVVKFLNIIHHEKGHNLSYRNITLSTCGLVPRIYDLADEGVPITLSISLHSPFDHIRKTIMPIAKKYSINDIIEAVRYYYEKTKRRITMEYTMMAGINDSNEDLQELIRILEGLNCHVNLIPLNPIEEFNKERSENTSIERFKNGLKKANIAVTVRKEMGADINAACGQLRRRFANKSHNEM